LPDKTIDSKEQKAPVAEGEVGKRLKVGERKREGAGYS